MATKLIVLDFKPLGKGQLRGFAKVQQPSGVIFNECPVLQSARGYWASPPSKPLIGNDGKVISDASGKPRYTQIIEFASSEIRDRWSEAVIEALRTSHPEAFAPGGAA
jgi:hypothetical protein